MPVETQVVVGAIILVFAIFMGLLAWAERRAGGRFEEAAPGRPAGEPEREAAVADVPETRRAA
jgi:uncharacterized iron-regulated membrane protein